MDKTTDSNWDRVYLLRKLAAARIDKDQKKLDEIVRSLPFPSDLEKELSSLEDEKLWASILREEKQKSLGPKLRLLLIGFIVFVFSFIAIAAIGSVVYAGLLCRNWQEGCVQVANGTFTPSPTLTSTPTSTPTLTPTATSTSTPTATFTPTPVSPSTYLVTDPSAINPAPPQNQAAYWLLDSRQAAIAASDAELWNSSGDMIYTSEGNTSFTWHMDEPLPEDGLYQLMVVDTRRYSYGQQTFEVLLDGNPTQPFRGTNTVIFQVEDKQEEDNWLSLGFYQIKAGQRLQVTAQIGDRSINTPFSLEKLLVIKVSENDRPMVEVLTSKRTLYTLLDDARAVSYLVVGDEYRLVSDFLQPMVDVPAWNSSFRVSSRPWEVPAAIYWRPVGRIPQGTYELFAYIPSLHATVPARYKLELNGILIERPNPADINQADFQNEWVSLGQWEIPNEGAVGVWMIVQPFSGEIGVDAVALVKVETEEP
jgi:hypothetical protein